jgi:ParB family chromosome partitioning protein
VGLEPVAGPPARTTARPEFSLIALICAGYEKTIQKDSWRSAEKRHFRYLNQLTIWGYTASAVEQIILDNHTTDTE